jgi:hypothetical protein
MKSNLFRTLRGQFLREVMTLLLFTSLMLQSMLVAAPGWWSTQNVLKPQVQADDYAVANIGQLKTMAANAANEMNAQIQQGAGGDINTLIAEWRNPVSAKPRDDYAALTQGQLKTVAKLFYDRLAVIGSLDQPAYPWGNGGVADDYALANIGQLKSVFSFLVPYMVWRLGDANNPSPDDLNQDGLSDAYAASNGLGGYPMSSDSNDNGVSDWVEAWNGGPIDGQGSKGGLQTYARTRSGNAHTIGRTPFVAGGDPIWYASISLDISSSSITTEDSSGTQTSNQGVSDTTTITSSDTYSHTHFGKLKILNSIITSTVQATGNTSPNYEVTLDADYSDKSTVSTTHTLSSSLNSSSEDDYTASINASGPPSADLSYSDPHLSGHETHTSQSGNGTSVNTESLWSISGYPQAPYGLNVPPQTQAATQITTEGSDSGSATTSDSGWYSTTTWDKSYSYLQQLSDPITLDAIVAAATDDINAHSWVGGENVPYDPLSFGGYVSANVGSTDGSASGGQLEYGFDYAVIGNATKALPAIPVNWFEVYTHTTKNGQGQAVTEREVTPRSVVLLPGQQAGPYTLDPLSRYQTGSSSAFIAHTGYVSALDSSPLERLTPTTAAPSVSMYIVNPDTDVVIDNENSQVSVKVSGFVFDQLAAALPAGSGADIASVDIYVGGGLSLEDVPLVPETLGDTVVPGYYTFGPVSVTAPLGERVVIEAQTSENLLGKTQRYGFVLGFDPVLDDPPMAQPRQISARLQLPAALSPTGIDTVGVLPMDPASGPSVPAVETDVDSRIFVTADGFTVNLPDGYTGLPTAQAIAFFIPSSGGTGDGVLVPGGSTVTCAETGADTNQYTYQEGTPGFELPADVVDWTYDGIWDVLESDDDGDYAPFTYMVGVSNSQVDPVGGLMLPAPNGTPQFSNHQGFKAFVVPNANADGYDLLYANQDAGTMVRVPCPGTLTAKVVVDESRIDGASISLWTLAWQDLAGMPSDGPAKMSAAALAAYVGRTDHDGVEIPDEVCARVAVTGLLTGYGVKVASSEGVDAFTLVPPAQMPSGTAIVSRIAQLDPTGDNSWRSPKIILYESTPEVDRLTDLEWNALKDAGYIAVHNSFASVTILSLANGVSTGVNIASATEQLHHVFQTFRDSSDVALRVRSKLLWKNLNINVDDFTVAWDRTAHLSNHRAITAQWKNFILNNTDSNGNLLKIVNGIDVTRFGIKRSAINLMFEQCDTFKIPIHDVQPYSRTIPKGTSLNKLSRLDFFDRRLWDEAKKGAVLKRWGGIVKNVASHQSATMIRKGILKNLGIVIASTYLVSGDVAGAASVAMDIPRNTAQLLLDADIDTFNWGMPAPKGGWQRYTFRDGSEIHLGDYFQLAIIDSKRKIERFVDGEVCDLTLKPDLPFNVIEVSVIFESDIQFLEDGSLIDWLVPDFIGGFMQNKVRRTEKFYISTYRDISNFNIDDVMPYNLLGVEYTWR